MASQQRDLTVARKRIDDLEAAADRNASAYQSLAASVAANAARRNAAPSPLFAQAPLNAPPSAQAVAHTPTKPAAGGGGNGSGNGSGGGGGGGMGRLGASVFGAISPIPASPAAQTPKTGQPLGAVATPLAAMPGAAMPGAATPEAATPSTRGRRVGAVATSGAGVRPPVEMQELTHLKCAVLEFITSRCSPQRGPASRQSLKRVLHLCPPVVMFVLTTDLGCVRAGSRLRLLPPTPSTNSLHTPPPPSPDDGAKREQLTAVIARLLHFSKREFASAMAVAKQRPSDTDPLAFFGGLLG